MAFGTDTDKNIREEKNNTPSDTDTLTDILPSQNYIWS